MTSINKIIFILVSLIQEEMLIMIILAVIMVLLMDNLYLMVLMVDRVTTMVENVLRQQWSDGNNGPRPQCQICGKLGHVAYKCYHRFNLVVLGPMSFHQQSSGFSGPQMSAQVAQVSAFAARIDSSTSDTSWYPNFGATNPQI